MIVCVCFFFDILTKSHMYGTNMRATPAARLPMPTPKLRTTVGYCMAVKVGIMALFAPIIHFAVKVNNFYNNNNKNISLFVLTKSSICELQEGGRYGLITNTQCLPIIARAIT